MRNLDQSNGEKDFQIFPTSVDTTLLIGWFYLGRIPNNGTATKAQAIATSEPGPSVRFDSTRDYTGYHYNRFYKGFIFRFLFTPGAVFASIGCMETLANLVATVVANIIYDNTISFFRGFVFIVFVAFNLLCCMLMM